MRSADMDNPFASIVRAVCDGTLQVHPGTFLPTAVPQVGCPRASCSLLPLGRTSSMQVGTHDHRRHHLTTGMEQGVWLADLRAFSNATIVCGLTRRIREGGPLLLRVLEHWRLASRSGGSASKKHAGGREKSLEEQLTLALVLSLLCLPPQARSMKRPRSHDNKDMLKA